MIHFKPFHGWFNNNLPLYYTQDITLLETVQHLICDYNKKLKTIEDSYNSLESTVYETFAKWERLFDEFTTKIENEWAEYKQNMRTEWENYKENLNNEWAEYKQNMRTEWNNYKKEMNEAFNQLKADMEAYKTEITNSFNKLKADFEALEDNVEAFKSDMTGKFTQLRSDWETYKTNLNSEWAQFKEDTTNDLTEYKTTLTNEWTKFKTDTTNDLTEYKSNLTNEWTTYKNEMNTNYNEFSENITAKITALEAEWDSFETAQNNKYSEFTANITEQINTIKTEWAAKQEEINNTISNIENEWTAFEGDITTQWTNYKNDVNNIISEFETEWTGWQETITNITNDNTQIKNDIETLKTTVADLQEQINNIQPSENGIAYIVADENTEIDADTYINQKSVLQFNNTNTFTNFPTDFSVSGVGYLWNLSGGQVITLINENSTNLINYTRKTGKRWVVTNAPIYLYRDTFVDSSVVKPRYAENFTSYRNIGVSESEIEEYIKNEYNANYTAEFESLGNPVSGLILTTDHNNTLLLVNSPVFNGNSAVTVPVLMLYDNENDKWLWIPSANAVFNSDTRGGIITQFTGSSGDNSTVVMTTSDFKTPIKTSVIMGLLNLPDLPTDITFNGNIALFPGYQSGTYDVTKMYITAEAFPVDGDVGAAMKFSGSCQPSADKNFSLRGQVSGAAPLKSNYVIIFKLYDFN